MSAYLDGIMLLFPALISFVFLTFLLFKNDIKLNKRKPARIKVENLRKKSKR